MDRVSRTPIGRNLTPDVLYERGNGTLVSLVGVSVQVPLSGWTDFATGVVRKGGRMRQVTSGVDREHIWSRIERESLSGGG